MPCGTPKLDLKCFLLSLTFEHLSFLNWLFFPVFLDVPDPPTYVITGNVTKFGCAVYWEPPESDGGSPITSYIIELRDRTSVKWTPVHVAKPTELSATINDVIENKEYIFRVKAENKAGVSKPSDASQPVKIMDPIGKRLNRYSLHYEISAALE